MAKVKKKKPVTVEIIERDIDGVIAEPYRVMLDVMKRYRPELVDCEIGLAWRRGWKVSVDGLLKAAHCKKRGDLDRALDRFDFVILLNAEVWAAMDGRERERLMYHELCHAQVCKDANGDTKTDEGGRPVCRVRKHDIEEFTEVAETFGMKATINDLARAALEDANRPLLKFSGKKGEDSAVIPKSESLVVKGRGMKMVSVKIDLVYEGPGKWRSGYQTRLGNYANQIPASEGPAFASRTAALKAAQLAVGGWLDAIEPTGTVEQKKDIERRRGILREQVADAIDAAIRNDDEADEGNGTDADGIPFEED